MVKWKMTPLVILVGELVLQERWWEREGARKEGVGMEVGVVEGYGGEMKGNRLTGEGCL